ncbi:putative Ig domain-containing protein [Photobacterium leiognathi]|uniref:putative Ig domain-containing protein n=1 Tax=Photobacterium leiognathi TaxID=553611 RepID=UPI00076A7250|nr:putative Ig domain-containing protein [Photobacterium leiognathi]
MKMNKLALVVLAALPLIGCGGGSDDNPVTPPPVVEPEVTPPVNPEMPSEETLNTITAAFDADPVLISTVCNDVSKFKCTVSTSTRTTQQEVELSSYDGLFYMATFDDKFIKDGAITVPRLDNMKPEFISSVDLNVRVITPSNIFNYVIDNARYTISHKHIVAYMPFSVFEFEQEQTLNEILKEEIILLEVQTVINGTDGSTQFDDQTINLNRDSYRAAMEIVQQRAHDLYQGNGETPPPPVDPDIEAPEILPPINTAPVFDSISPIILNAGDRTHMMITAMDKENDHLTYSSDELLSFIDLMPNGQLNLYPNDSDVGTYIITATVSDGSLSNSVDITVKVNEVPVVNNPPYIQYPDNVDVVLNENTSQSLHIIAGDPDGDELTLSVDSDLPWINFNVESGYLLLTPTYSDAGEYEFNIVVSDGELTDSIPAKVIVNNVASPVEFAELVKEPLKKVEALFNHDQIEPNIVDGSPVIKFIQGSGMRFYEFNIDKQSLRVGGLSNTALSGDYELGEKVTSLTVSGVQINEFESEYVRRYDNHPSLIETVASTTYTQDIIDNMLLNFNDTATSGYACKSALSDEWITCYTGTHTEYVSNEYLQYVGTIISKFM